MVEFVDNEEKKVRKKRRTNQEWTIQRKKKKKNNPEKEEEEEEQSRETGNIGQTRQKQTQKYKKMNNIKMLDITTRNDTFVYVD